MVSPSPTPRCRTRSPKSRRMVPRAGWRERSRWRSYLAPPPSGPAHTQLPVPLLSIASDERRAFSKRQQKDRGTDRSPHKDGKGTAEGNRAEETANGNYVGARGSRGLLPSPSRAQEPSASFGAPALRPRGLGGPGWGVLQGHQELWEWGAVTCLGPGVATPPPRALLSPGNLRLTDLGGWMLSPTTAMGHPSATPETPGQGVSWVEKGVLGLEGEPWTWRQKLRRKG